METFGGTEWPPYRADRAIYEDVVGKSIGDGNIDPELPTELIPPKKWVAIPLSKYSTRLSFLINFLIRPLMRVQILGSTGFGTQAIIQN